MVQPTSSPPLQPPRSRVLKLTAHPEALEAEGLSVKVAEYTALVHDWNECVAPLTEKLRQSHQSMARRLGEVIRRVGTSFSYAFTRRNAASLIAAEFLQDESFRGKILSDSSIAREDLVSAARVLYNVGKLDLVEPKGRHGVSASTNALITEMGVAILRAHSRNLGERPDIIALDRIFSKVVRYLTDLPTDLARPPFQGSARSIEGEQLFDSLALPIVYDSRLRYEIIIKMSEAARAISDMFSQEGVERSRQKVKESLTDLFLVARGGTSGNGAAIVDSRLVTYYLYSAKPDVAEDEFDNIALSFAQAAERIAASTNTDF